ncbi:MAG: FG-GAP-like repeat-containing protein [Bacteroidota bacterium]
MRKYLPILFVLLNVTLVAQQPHINWWFDTNDASFGQPAAGDIDNDGKLEVVFGCYRNDSCVYALNAEDGTLLWKYNTHPAGAEGCNDVAPIIYDIDNDDSLEVIVPSSCNPKTFCFNGRTGVVKWQTPTRGSDSPPTIADIDNDGKPEILHGEFGGYVICINAENGSVSWEIPVDLDSWIQTAPTIVDLDNNGQLDFVVGTWNATNYDSNKVYAYRGNDHSLIWKYPVRDVMYHGFGVSDLDSDGKPELVVGSYNDTLYCINGDDGTTCWKYAYASSYYTGAPPSIADIDNDGSCEVVFVSWYVVGALSSSGNLKWHYSIPGYEQAFRGAALSDINNDDYLDVIFGTDGGLVYALNGNNGSLIWAKDLAAHYGNSLFEFDNAPLIADFNGDDTLDVFIVGGHAEYPDFQNDFGRAYMISAGVGNGPDWLMFQNNILRNSSLCADTTSDIPTYEFPENIITVYPNPASSFIFIKSDEKIAEAFLIDIFGKKYSCSIEQNDNKGQIISFDKMKDGIYFLDARNNEGERMIRKIIIIN